jgi:hypothetical protein
MTTQLDPTLLPALDAIQGALEQPAKRPGLDRRQLLNSMQRMDWEMRLRHYPAVMEAEYERDAAEFFAAEQCPADSNFR